MFMMRANRAVAFLFMALAFSSLTCPLLRAQAAMLMEEPFGFFGFLNPTGHDAVYFDRICAETPIKLRRCAPGELGAVITRYQGIAHYDWIAMPLFPYLYSVESASEFPANVDRETVTGLRDQYHDSHLLSLGKEVPRGGDVKRGWSQFVGVAYERRIYAFRFETTEAQDNALIARLNAEANRSRFNLLYRNCADFTRDILNFYFPGAFRRSVLPDAGITTPRQLTYELVSYARKHPETQLTMFDIRQVTGYRRRSRRNQSLVWGRYPLNLNHLQILTPQSMDQLGSAPVPANATGLP